LFCGEDQIHGNSTKILCGVEAQEFGENCPAVLLVEEETSKLEKGPLIEALIKRGIHHLNEHQPCDQTFQ
jgi:hypothetical protein